MLNAARERDLRVKMNDLIKELDLHGVVFMTLVESTRSDGTPVVGVTGFIDAEPVEKEKDATGRLSSSIYVQTAMYEPVLKMMIISLSRASGLTFSAAAAAIAGILDDAAQDVMGNGAQVRVMTSMNDLLSAFTQADAEELYAEDEDSMDEYALPKKKPADWVN